MTEQKNNRRPKVEIYKIANRLREKLGIRPHDDREGYLPPEAIEEADKLIEELCMDCPDAIGGCLEELSEQWSVMKDMPQSQEREEISQKIFTLSHEIKDIAALCGYNLAAYFAESLRDYIGQTELNLQAQRVIIQAHLDAMQAVHRGNIKDDAGPAAEELKEAVKIAIDKYK